MQQIVVGFTQIINTVTSDIQAMQGVQPFTVQSDEESILNAFTTVGNHFPHAITFRLTVL